MDDCQKCNYLNQADFASDGWRLLASGVLTLKSKFMKRTILFTCARVTADGFVKLWGTSLTSQICLVNFVVLYLQMLTVICASYIANVRFQRRGTWKINMCCESFRVFYNTPTTLCLFQKSLKVLTEFIKKEKEKS